jgi:hypothetical protein
VLTALHSEFDRKETASMQAHSEAIRVVKEEHEATLSALQVPSHAIK